jgi:hypothetical protein
MSLRLASVGYVLDKLVKLAVFRMFITDNRSISLADRRPEVRNCACDPYFHLIFCSFAC